MPVLGIPAVSDIQNDKMLPKVLRVVVVVVVPDRRPRDVDEVVPTLTLTHTLTRRPAFQLSPDRGLKLLENLPARDAPAPVDVAHDVRPQGPRALVPGRVGVLVEGRADREAEEGRAEGVGEDLVREGRVADARQREGAGLAGRQLGPQPVQDLVLVKGLREEGLCFLGRGPN